MQYPHNGLTDPEKVRQAAIDYTTNYRGKPGVNAKGIGAFPSHAKEGGGLREGFRNTLSELYTPPPDGTVPQLKDRTPMVNPAVAPAAPEVKEPLIPQDQLANPQIPEQRLAVRNSNDTVDQGFMENYIKNSGYEADKSDPMAARIQQAADIQAGRERFIKNSESGMYDLGDGAKTAMFSGDIRDAVKRDYGNDNTPGSAGWFQRQYEMKNEQDFQKSDDISARTDIAQQQVGNNYDVGMNRNSIANARNAQDALESQQDFTFKRQQAAQKQSNESAKYDADPKNFFGEAMRDKSYQAAYQAAIASGDPKKIAEFDQLSVKQGRPTMQMYQMYLANQSK